MKNQRILLGKRLRSKEGTREGLGTEQGQTDVGKRERRRWPSSHGSHRPREGWLCLDEVPTAAGLPFVLSSQPTAAKPHLLLHNIIFVAWEELG